MRLVKVLAQATPGDGTWFDADTGFLYRAASIEGRGFRNLYLSGREADSLAAWLDAHTEDDMVASVDTEATIRLAEQPSIGQDSTLGAKGGRWDKLSEKPF